MQTGNPQRDCSQQVVAIGAGIICQQDFPLRKFFSEKLIGCANSCMVICAKIKAGIVGFAEFEEVDGPSKTGRV